MTALLKVDASTGLRRSPVRHPDGSPPPSDGCRWCGTGFWHHRMPLYAGSVGLHEWARPTQAQVAARGKARKAARVPFRVRLRASCDAMNHDSVGNERFCEIEDPDHDEDHDAGDGLTWPREDRP